MDHINAYPLQHAFEVSNEDDTRRFNVSWQLNGNKLTVYINGLTGDYPRCQTIITTHANTDGFQTTWPTLTSTNTEFQHPVMLYAQDDNTLLVQINAWGIVRSMFFEDITDQSARGARVDNLEQIQLPAHIDVSVPLDPDLEDDPLFASQMPLDRIMTRGPEVIQLSGTEEIIPCELDAFEDRIQDGFMVIKGRMDMDPKTHRIRYGYTDDGTPILLELSTQELQHLVTRGL